MFENTNVKQVENNSKKKKFEKHMYRYRKNENCSVLISHSCLDFCGEVETDTARASETTLQLYYLEKTNRQSSLVSDIKLELSKDKRMSVSLPPQRLTCSLPRQPRL